MTIYDIAKQAGVSIATVSRVLNGAQNVSPRTRKKVQEILRQSGYQPNQIAQGLANRQSHTVGVLVMDVRDVHHSSIAYVIERVMAAGGYGSILCNLGGTQELLENYLRMLHSHQVSGVFLVGSMFSGDRCKELIQQYASEVPVLITNGSLPLQNVYGVEVDEAAGMREAVEYLIGCGRSRIALVSSSDTPSERAKYSGYIQAMRAHGLTEIHISTQRSIEGGRTATARLMETVPGIDAIQYTEDITAAGGVHVLHERGVAIPEQVAVIGYNNSIYCSICYPSITSVDNKLLKTGQEAARWMLRLLEKKPETEKVPPLACTLVHRNTTPKQ